MPSVQGIYSLSRKPLVLKLIAILNIRAVFAYPEEQERRQEITKVMNAIKTAQGAP
jgi:hypothetical protein